MTALVAPLRDGRWTADPGLGVYVHIPFCKHRCHYCDFNTYEGLDDLHAPYVAALIADIERWQGDLPPAVSVFFGGGTPTLLPSESLGRILAAIRERVGLAPDAEVTIEANPETVDERRFTELLAAGFNRVSIGVQSTAAGVLARLGRTHDAATALDALGAARRAGFEEINADLIYGSPWETTEDWRRSLDEVIDAGPTHVSAYALTVEEGTPLSTLVATGRVPDVDPDVQADRHALAEERLGRAGFDRYEVSNWGRPGSACRHNLVYWCSGDYLAFGAGAHGHLRGRRWWNVRLPRDYIGSVAGGRSVEAGHERLSSEQRAAEAVMLGLRLAQGIDVTAFSQRFGSVALEVRAEPIAVLVEEGLLVREKETLRLAARATMVANEVIARVM